MAKTHSSLTFDELCEEAFGSGLHPWEFYQYSLIEYLQRRKGIYKQHRANYREQLIAAMLPYMEKNARVKIVNDAFKEEGAKVISLKEQYNKILKRYEDAGVAGVMLKAKDGSK